MQTGSIFFFIHCYLTPFHFYPLILLESHCSQLVIFFPISFEERVKPKGTY